MDHAHSKDKLDNSDARSVRSTGSSHGSDAGLQALESISRHGSPKRPPPLLLSSSLKRGGNSGAHDVSEAPPSDRAPAMGESILIKRGNQLILKPISDFRNAPLGTLGSPRIGKSPLKSNDLDNMISRLLDAGRYSNKISKTVCLTNAEISAICFASQELLLSQPALLELPAPVKIVGDIRGHYTDLIRLFDMCGFPPASNYLFLGGYVNRGRQSLETILLLLCYKLKYPENIFLLRGNHECASLTREYGFYDECERRSNKKIWRSFIDTFNCLPIASIVAGKVFCVHGGLSPSRGHLDDIRAIPRPTDVPDHGLLTDLLWSDPDDIEEDWKPNERGVGYCFGKRVIVDFLQRHDFDLVCRAHMPVEDGYEFYQDRILVTLFSAPNYCGEFNNWGAVMSVSDDLLCSFELRKPLEPTAMNHHARKGRDKLNSDEGILRTNENPDDILENTFEHGNDRGAPSEQMPTGSSKAVLSNVSQVAMDAQTRLPEPSDISLLRLAGDLFKATLNLYIIITQRVAQTKHSRRLCSELERFFLWGDGFSVSSGQLDEVLSKSSELRQTVLSTLYELGRVIEYDLLLAVDGIIQSEELGGSDESVLKALAQSVVSRELQPLLKKAATVLVAPEPAAAIESLSDDGSTRYDLDQILDDIAIYIDCLMDLSLALENPVVDLEPVALQ